MLGFLTDFRISEFRSTGQKFVKMYYIQHLPKAEWAIDSEAMSARGIIVLVKSN